MILERKKGQWSESASRVLRERYLWRKDGKILEDEDGMCARVARAVAEAERTWGASEADVNRATEQFSQVMLDRQFMPNSPTLMNAGKNNGQQLSACFVLPVGDSLPEIFDAIKHAAIIHKSGGGTGFGLSRLRSEGSEVATTRGVASGPVSFLRVFNAATEAVKQGGTRRGANMGVLRVDHPDILKFIECKRPDPVTGVRDITNFNISVAATDAFMEALEHRSDYELRDPHTGKVTGTLNAREVFDKICAAAWSTGDPGLLFIDRANHSASNPIPELEQIEATNPCLVAETFLATGSGPRRLGDLHASGEAITVGTDARAASGALALREVVNGTALPAASTVVFRPAAPVFQTGRQVPVLKLITSHGIEITATPNHRFLTTDGFRRLDELRFGDTLLLQSAEGNWSTNPRLPDMPPFGMRGATRQAAWERDGRIAPPRAWSRELGEVLGYLAGDGYLRYDGRMQVVGMAVSDNDHALADLIQERLKGWFGYQGSRVRRQGHLQLQYTGLVPTFFAGLGLTSALAGDRRVPETVFGAPREAVVGFLRGLFSANGSVQSSVAKGACSVRLATSSRGLARDVQQLLLNFGIVSVIRLRRNAGFAILPDGARAAASYPTQAQYEVIIDKANRDRFATEIGFLQERKQEHLREWIFAEKRVSNRETFTTQVALIEDAGLADVFDTTEPVTHSIIANGLVTHQCGEQWLGGYDACNLGSINLAECVTKQPDGTYAINWAELDRVTRVTTRFLDDVIEINPLPLPEINDTVRANRRIGLGIMGWADLLFLLAVPYDSEAALALGEEVMRFVNRIAHDESQVLARSRGAFPNFPRSIYRDGPPLRNATLTTVAPTGTISIIADCSSGIEPVFALAFTHMVDRGKPTERRLVMSNPIFARIAREQGFYSDALMEKISEHGSVVGLDEVPEHWQRVFVNAHEVSPEWHIRMQAAFQHGVDNSISKTVNLPNESSVQDIEDAYLMAWAEGCKGITVFRDGCLSTGQVLNVGTKVTPAASPSTPAVSPAPQPERPAPSLPATVKPRPPVVFGYTRQVKAPEGTANITINTDETGPVEVFLSVGRAGSDIAALAEALGRLISLTLRLPSPIEPDERLRLIATQLRGIGGSRSIGFGANRVLSLPDALGQAFMSHLEQGLSKVPAPINRPMNGNGSDHGGSYPTPTQLTLPTVTVLGNLCPQCGSSSAFVLEEGCKKCHGCGYSEC
ncbi:MAG TPA: LAGLIDADG family homing endonuclease [Chloroflexota bacterium]|nr:LAGLIDADG family homing endonuclease [Chloroflexota bacterium]